ncbi:MAG: hypothetical protein RDU14_17390 [Melioribacteraceae bacterium]|nr:hypothetical protein [Melioribacteraceae bacterium]
MILIKTFFLMPSLYLPKVIENVNSSASNYTSINSEINLFMNHLKKLEI